MIRTLDSNNPLDGVVVVPVVLVPVPVVLVPVPVVLVPVPVVLVPVVGGFCTRPR